MTRTATVIEDLFQAMRTWARVLDASELDAGDTGFDVAVSEGRVKHFVGIGDAAHWTKLRIKEWIGRVSRLHQELSASATGDLSPTDAGKPRQDGDLFQADAEKHPPDPYAGIPRVTREQLASWRAVERAATPGPWEAGPAYNNAGCPTSDFSIPGHNQSATVELLAVDAAFAVMARTAVPALLEEVSRLRAEVADLRTAVIAVATTQIRRYELAEHVHAYRQVANDHSEPFSIERVEQRIEELIANHRSER